jgi:hypothetical protein
MNTLVSRPKVLGFSENFASSRQMDILTAGTGTLLSAYVAYGLTTRQSPWASLFWIFSGVSGMKVLHDMSASRPE